MLIEYKIMLPNPTSLYAQEEAAVLDYCLKTFGGYTFGRHDLEGAWDSGSKVHVEPMRPLFIASDNFNRVLEFCNLIKQLFNQEAVYLVKVGEVAIIE